MIVILDNIWNYFDELSANQFVVKFKSRSKCDVHTKIYYPVATHLQYFCCECKCLLI